MRSLRSIRTIRTLRNPFCEGEFIGFSLKIPSILLQLLGNVKLWKHMAIARHLFCFYNTLDFEE